MADIVFVRPDTFDPKDTVAISQAIAAVNRALVREQRPYLLMGPGRWGSFDRWLGIPVKWMDINGVGPWWKYATQSLNADPSQGSHFFQNITTNGIPYLTVTEGSDDIIRWNTLQALPLGFPTTYLNHVRLQQPLVLKCDGRHSRAVILLEETPPPDEFPMIKRLAPAMMTGLHASSAAVRRSLRSRQHLAVAPDAPSRAAVRHRPDRRRDHGLPH
jgi:hypothetical protein